MCGSPAGSAHVARACEMQQHANQKKNACVGKAQHFEGGEGGGEEGRRRGAGKCNSKESAGREEQGEGRGNSHADLFGCVCAWPSVRVRKAKRLPAGGNHSSIRQQMIEGATGGRDGRHPRGKRGQTLTSAVGPPKSGVERLVSNAARQADSTPLKTASLEPLACFSPHHGHGTDTICVFM